MALQKQTIPISLAQGLDTKTDPKQVVPGKLVALENGRFVSPGRIEKRFGHTAFGKTISGSSSSISAGFSLDSFKDEIVESDGSTLYSYSVASDNWTSKGNAFNIAVTESPVVRNDYQQTSQDSATHSSGLQVFVWEDTQGGTRYSAIDRTTQQQYVSNALLSATGSVPKAYAIGNFVIIIQFDSSDNRLQYAKIAINQPTLLSSFTDVSSNSNTTPAYDAQIIGSRLFIAYNNNTSGISLIYFDSFLNTSGILTIGSEAATTGISLFGDVAQNVWVVYYNGTSVKGFIRNYDLTNTAVLAPTVIETVANVGKVSGVYNGTNGLVYYDITNGTKINYRIRQNTLTVGGIAGTAASLIRSVGLASKIFSYNSNQYVLVSYDGSIQPTYFLINQSGSVVGKLSPSTGGGIPTKNLVPNVNTVSSGIFQFSFLQKDFVTAVSGSIYFLLGVMQATLDFTQTQLQTVDIGNNLHITGGFLSIYDGVSVIEQGFHLFPDTVTVGTSGAGGLILAGSYQYVAVYEWTDNFGQIHRSAPSIAVTQVTTGTTSTNTITVPTLRLTAKQTPRSPISIVLYRTLVNQTVFFRQSSITSPTLNSTTTDTVVFTDTLADSSIQGNQELYTTGGELENIVAPVPKAVWSYKNRVFVIDAENQLSTWFSKQVIPGTPVEFSDFFVQNIDSRGGSLVAGQQMDDKNILFKESDIFYQVGDGPAPSGINNDLTEPALITTDVGCSSAKSIVSMPLGLMFKSLKGIYLLQRNLEAIYVGSDVETYNDNNVTSAILEQESNLVRFTLDSGVILTYDYFMRQWSVDTGLNGSDATIFQNKYVFVQPNGLVLQETVDLFTDNQQFIKLKLITSWLNFGGLQAYVRVWKLLILGEYKSQHKLLVRISNNFNNFISQENYIDPGTMFNTPNYGGDAFYGDSTPYGGPNNRYQFRIHMQQQKIESIQISIEDTQASNFGEGFNISDLAFEVGIKKGLYKLSAAQSVG